MILIFTILVGQLWANETEKCLALLSDPAFERVVYETGRADLPESVRKDPGAAALIESIDNLITVPDGGAVVALNQRYLAGDASEPNKISRDLIVWIREQNEALIVRPGQTWETSFVPNLRDRAITHLKTTDVVRRSYRAGPVVYWDVYSAVVPVYADQRYDEFATVPYLVRIEDNHVTAVTSAALPADEKRARMLRILVRDVQRGFPGELVIEVKTSLTHFDQLCARIKTITRSGQESVHLFEITYLDDRNWKIALIDPADPRLLRHP